MLGLVAGIDNLGAGIAFAALLFPSSLAVGLSMGVGSMLLSGTVIALVIALLSSHKNSVGMVQETAIAILAASSAGALAGMTDASDDAKVATVFAILGISTVATGALFWCAGRFRLGGLVRFLPYPVVAGFLAGSGWLLVEGAVTMLTGEHSVVHGIAKIGDPLIQAKIIPAFVFGVAMMAALHRWSHPMIPTSLLLWAGVTFYAILALAGIPAEQARNYGWLPEIPGDGSVALPMPNWILSNANWNAVLIALPAIASVAFLNIVGVLLNISGLEVAAGKEIDVNVELRSSGWANLASGIAGGASGYVGLGMTLLAGRMQANGRGAGIATALVLGGGLLVATDLASLMPSFLAAGLMLFLGLELLAEWAYASRRQLPVEEWLIVVAILGIVSALAIPNFLRYQAQSRQSEARTNLSAIYVSETTYYGEQTVFGNFTQIGYALAGTQNRYAYRVGPGTTVNVDLLLPGVGVDMGQNPIVPSGITVVPIPGFTAVATANLDGDLVMDAWHVNDIKQNLQSADQNDAR